MQITLPQPASRPLGASETPRLAPPSLASLVWSVLLALVLVLALASPSAWAVADANKASAEELQSVKGVGPGISTRILDERKKGAFKDWTDFIGRVKGIGEGNAAKFSGNGLNVNGAAFQGVAPSAVAASASASKGRMASKDKKP